MLKLDRSSTQSVFVETNKTRNSRSDFQPMLVYLYRVSFLTALDIYEDYFKGYHACKKWQSSLFSLNKLLCFYVKGFMTKELPNLHYYWTKELCSQKHLQVDGVSHVLGSVHHWLVKYWNLCIERKDCRYNTSPIGYWSKGLTVSWYFGIGQRVW